MFMIISKLIVFWACFIKGCYGNQVCDVLAAVACFEDLSGAPEADQIVIDPKEEIFEPCKLQLEIADVMRDCLNNVLQDCKNSSLYKDTNAFVNYRTLYCKEVVGCGEQIFSSQYHRVLDCSTGLREDLKKAANTSEEAKTSVCNDYLTCLTSASETCTALTMLAENRWSDFQRTCAAANVTMEIEQPDITQTYCSNLQVKAMNLHKCHQDFQAAEDGKDLQETCSVLKTFTDCGTSATIRCYTLEDAFLEVSQQLTDIIQPFCSREGKCHYYGVTDCYQGFDGFFWKLSDIIPDPLNLSELYDNIAQATSLFRGIMATCGDIDDKVASILQCLQTELNGCPAEFDTDFIMKADFTKQFCSEITACSNMTALDSGMHECMRTAETSLKNLTKTITFQQDFCGVFEDYSLCVQDVFANCPGDSMYIAGIWKQLHFELKSVCASLNLHFENYTSMEQVVNSHIACGDLVDRANELGKCEENYMKSLTSDLSNKVNWCNAFTKFEACLLSVKDNCHAMTDHIDELIDITAQTTATTCQTDDVTDNTDDVTKGAGQPNGSDQTSGNRADNLTYSFVPFITVALLILLK